MKAQTVLSWVTSPLPCDCHGHGSLTHACARASVQLWQVSRAYRLGRGGSRKGRGGVPLESVSFSFVAEYNYSIHPGIHASTPICTSSSDDAIS